MPLLAFHGDISIPEKWRAAKRIGNWWYKNRKPVRIYYYGDYDPKGLVIPDSAWNDIRLWAMMTVRSLDDKLPMTEYVDAFHFERVGINQEHIDQFNIPENPERPGTYQWEALDDTSARVLIAQSEERLSMEAFEGVEAQEQDIIKRFRERLNVMEDNDDND
jgi:hypothetical protein